MESDYVFISYSHRQFYFAEALALRLQHLGVRTWLDVQRLVPGDDWQAGLTAGLASCTGLVLVASRVALASTHVRAEWQTALADHKPIFLVLFEPVRLPPELRSAARLDGRRAFDRQARRLAEGIRSGTVPRRRLPWANPLHVPTRLPFPVWYVAMALWLIAVVYGFEACILAWGAWTLAANWSLADPRLGLASLSFAASMLTVALVVWWHTIAFTFRRLFSYDDLRGLTLIAPTILGVTSFRWADLLMGPNGSPAALDPLVGWLNGFGLLFPILLLLGGAAALVLTFSGAVLRWLPTGTAPDRLRRRANETWSKPAPTRPTAAAPRPPETATWCLHYHPDDQDEERMASAIRTAMGSYSLLQERPAPAARTHLAIITDTTPRDWFDALETAYPNVVLIVARSIRVPHDAEPMHRNQWVDYRLRSDVSLQEMASLLDKPDAQSRRYPFPTVPESLDRFASPRTVKVLAGYAWSIGVFNVAVGTALLVSAFPRGVNPASWGVHALVPLLIGGVFFWLANRLLTARVTASVTNLCFLLADGGMLVFGVLADVLKLSALSAVIGLAVTPLAVLFFGQDSITTWLPRRMHWHPRLQQSTLAVPVGRRLWGRNLVYLLVALELLVPFAQAFLGTGSSGQVANGPASHTGPGGVVATYAPPLTPPPTSTVTASPQFAIRQFSLPTAQSLPQAIAVGPDGNLWVGETYGNNIARITPVGTVKEFPLPATQVAPEGMVRGPDGNLWFLVGGPPQVGRITPHGVITEFPLPDQDGILGDLVVGHDGNLWFTEMLPQLYWRLGRITPEGKVTEFPALDQLTGSDGVAIAAGPDGNLWLMGSTSIVRVSSAGQVVGPPIDISRWGPIAITQGPDRNMWFVGYGATVGKITLAGTVTTYAIGATNAYPIAMTRGVKGDLWFTDQGTASIGHISSRGSIIEIPIPGAPSKLGGIVARPDGSVWFTEPDDNQVGELIPIIA